MIFDILDYRYTNTDLHGKARKFLFLSLFCVNRGENSLSRKIAGCYSARKGVKIAFRAK